MKVLFGGRTGGRPSSTGPKASGRARQGEPLRTIQRTSSTHIQSLRPLNQLVQRSYGKSPCNGNDEADHQTDGNTKSPRDLGRTRRTELRLLYAGLTSNLSQGLGFRIPGAMFKANIPGRGGMRAKISPNPEWYLGERVHRGCPPAPDPSAGRTISTLPVRGV
ncbi:hypothetical protein [Paracoccus ravus]|uniref:hypothetical protein n=1 Tax=Paracoccus ravus TaxID=2447760 RepID=UPI0014306514|nr:hypothetical protein [Paracoccus ravus]